MTTTIVSASRSSLESVAQALTADLQGDGSHRHVQFPQGLQVLMQRTQTSCQRRKWRLALAREQDYPSVDEVEACCAAFKVPESGSRRRTQRCRIHPKSKRRIQYCIVELTWLEREPVL